MSVSCLVVSGGSQAYVAPGPTDEIAAAAEEGGLMSSGYSTLLTLPSWSVSDLAVWSCFQSPSATNYHVLACVRHVRAVFCHDGANGASSSCPTHLVQYLLVVLECDGLLEHCVFLVELHRLAPIVKGAGYVDLFRWMCPCRNIKISTIELQPPISEAIMSRCRLCSRGVAAQAPAFIHLQRK
jgi:hypothetical protein